MDNNTIIRTGNLTALNTLNNYIRSGDFDLRNVSNYSQFTRSADFNLGNISNDTLHLADNLSMKAYVDTFNKSVDLSSYNKSVDLSGYSKSSFVNGSDINVTLLNVVKINGTSLDLFNKSVDLSSYNKSVSLVPYPLRTELAVYLTNNSPANYSLNSTWSSQVPCNGIQGAASNLCTITSGAADASVFNLLNLTNYFGDSGFNGSVLRVTNNSFFSQFMRSADFNLGNISNNSLTLGALDNNTIIRTGNLTALNTLNNYIRSGDFDLRNVSNYSQFIKSADFNLGNISNNTLTKDNNASIALWNVTNPRVISPNTAEIINLTGRNLTGATNISATRFTGSINCGMIDGGSDGDYCADATGSADTSVFNNVNLTSFFGNDLDVNNTFLRKTNVSFFAPFWNLINLTNYFGGTDINASLIRSGNLTTLDTLNNYIRTKDFNIGNISNYSQFIKSSDFNLGNISNNTLTKDNNASIALWNVTGIRTIAPKTATVINLTGNVTLGNTSAFSSIFFNGSGICINSC